MYKFSKVKDDEFLIEHEETKIEFKRTIKTAQRLQGLDSEARFKVMQKISQMGYTMDNNPFIVEKKEGSKVYRDESNFNYLIEEEKKITMAEIVSDIVLETTKHGLDDLVRLLGIDATNEIEIAKFASEFMYIIKTGEVFGTEKTPSTNN